RSLSYDSSSRETQTIGARLARPRGPAGKRFRVHTGGRRGRGGCWSRLPRAALLGRSMRTELSGVLPIPGDGEEAVEGHEARSPQPSGANGALLAHGRRADWGGQVRVSAVREGVAQV